MAYQESVEWLFEQVPMFQNLGAGAYKPGLETTLRLSEAMGNPHKNLKCIHIAGTNGKGSTAHTIAAILQSAGYRVGLYTSPHLADFRERIRVDGRMADKAFVETFIERFRNGDLKQMQPTFFELTTILAFCYFEHMGVDVAVIETGLGGRLDSTNIINPELCVITNISLDHTALLGNTEAEIATEKAGIIKKDIPVVIGKAARDVRAVFSAKAQQENAPIYFAEDAPAFKEAIASEDAIRYIGTQWGEIEGELCGDCQSENAATIMTALGILCRKFPLIDASAIKRGFAEVCSITGLMGRWMQTEDRGIRIICDTGHNIGGWQYLGPRLKKISESDGTLRMVLGFVNDKDISAIMEQMPHDARYYLASPSVRRGRTAESTLEYAASAGISGRAFGNVAEAYAAAKAEALAGDTIFIGGSTFIVADYLTSVRKDSL